MAYETVEGGYDPKGRDAFFESLEGLSTAVDKDRVNLVCGLDDDVLDKAGKQIDEFYRKRGRLEEVTALTPEEEAELFARLAEEPEEKPEEGRELYGGLDGIAPRGIASVLPLYKR